MLKKYYLVGFFLVPIPVKQYQNMSGFAGARSSLSMSIAFIVYIIIIIMITVLYVAWSLYIIKIIYCLFVCLRGSR